MKPYLLAAMALLCAARASAQQEAGGLAGVTVSAVGIDEDVAVSIAATLGYRLNPTLALGMEFTFVPDFRPSDPDLVTIAAGPITTSPIIGIYPPPHRLVEPGGGHAAVFTGNLRLTIPTTSTRWAPYFVGGAGVANVRREFELSILLPSAFAGLAYHGPAIAYTSTDFAMTAGGGVEMRLTDRLSVDAGARYLGIFGRHDSHGARVGAGLSFAF